MQFMQLDDDGLAEQVFERHGHVHAANGARAHTERCASQVRIDHARVNLQQWKPVMLLQDFVLI